MIKPISNQVRYNKRTIPRYLYHLTTKENYTSIIKDGVIKATHDANPVSNLKGVFLFDMINFIKRWMSTGFKIDSENNKFSLAQALFLNVIIKSRNLVLLRIPTKNLSTNLLQCRVQNITESEFHANNGDSATKQKHYTRKKKPIEYIFQDNIPVKEFAKIGEVDSQINYTKHQDLASFGEIDSLSLLEKLLVNQPEENAINLAKKSSFEFVDLFKP